MVKNAFFVRLKKILFIIMNNIDTEKIYLGFVPNDKKSLVRKNKCRYDFEIHKWFTTDKSNKMIEDFERVELDFWSLINELGLTYDKEKRTWYTYKTNEKISKEYFNT
jgi:hypothetical protein